jgi:hypothetical protein
MFETFFLGNIMSGGRRPTYIYRILLKIPFVMTLLGHSESKCIFKMLTILYDY